MIRRLFILFKKRVLMELLIRFKILNKKSFKIKDKKISFHDLSKSTLLKQITVDGYRSFEGEVVTLIENYPWHIDKFIDAGAYIGFYSIIASIYMPKGVEVIAVEPFPDNIEYIKRLKRVNNIEFKLIEKALDIDKNSKAIIYYPVSSRSSKLPNSSSLINSFKGTDGIFSHIPYKTKTVQTTTLPLVAGDDSSDILIKLDCEENELNILKGSMPLLKRGNADFIMELMINSKNKREIFDLMKDYGYDAYLITNAGLVEEERPLTLPKPGIKDRTLWKNHFFTKRPKESVRETSLALYGYSI
ncbi:MAG: FkbM family methyltransferase [Candidatus Omnitrophica bacterium]|nr:FkbM family methyltransferase [Candidatus Omnitrophota bacterium]